MASILGSIAPTTVTGQELFIVIKVFFDGGNKADSTQFKVLTLAGYAATDAMWGRLEKAWSSTLSLHGAPYMHMKEAINLSGSFTLANGWNRTKVGELLKDLISVIGTFKKVPMRAIACTVLLQDYQSVRKKGIELPPVEQLCVTQCIGVALVWYTGLPGTHNSSHLPEKSVDLHFDRGEPFRAHASDAWNNKTLRMRSSFKAIRQISESAMKSTPGLQMADMLAWAHNREYGKGGHEALCHAIKSAIPIDSRILKLPELADVDVAKLNKFTDLGLPPRKPMR